MVLLIVACIRDLIFSSSVGCARQIRCTIIVTMHIRVKFAFFFGQVKGFHLYMDAAPSTRECMSGIAPCILGFLCTRNNGNSCYNAISYGQHWFHH